MLAVDGDRVLVVAPHPDDEVLGCGGTLALHCRRGDAVFVVWLTGGGRGVPGVGEREAVRVRLQEGAAAIEALGATEPGELFDLPDGGVAAHHEQAVARLGEVIDRRLPSVVYAPHPGDAHPDHQAAFSCTVQAMQRHAPPDALLLGYEVWSPLSWPEVSHDIGAVLEVKERALRCHRSQLRQVPYLQLSAGLAAYRGAMTLGCAVAESFTYHDWRVSA